MPASYEQRLPPGQQSIRTSNVRRLENICQVVIDRRRLHGYSTIVVTTGPAGSGKTIAAQYVLDHQSPRAHTSLPAIVRITLTSGSTRKMQVSILATELKESVSGNQDQIGKGI